MIFEVARPVTSGRTKKLSTYSMARATSSYDAVPCWRRSSRLNRSGYTVVVPHALRRSKRILTSGSDFENRVEQRLEQLLETREASDLRLDLLLGGQPGLLRRVDVGLLHIRVALHQVKPEQLLQLGARQPLLQLKP